MKIGVRDGRVIAAFVKRQPAKGHKLSTDGERLDGHWMGGSGIAEWRSGVIKLNDLGSRAAQTVQRAVTRQVKQVLVYSSNRRRRYRVI